MKIGRSSQSASYPCLQYCSSPRRRTVALAFPRYDGWKTRLSYRVRLFTIIITWTRYVVIYFTSAIHCANSTLCCTQCDAVWIVVYPVGSFTVPCPDVGVWPRGVRGGQTSRQVLYLIKSRQCSERPNHVTTPMVCRCLLRHATWYILVQVSCCTHASTLCNIFGLISESDDVNFDTLVRSISRCSLRGYIFFVTVDTNVRTVVMTECQKLVVKIIIKVS